MKALERKAHLKRRGGGVHSKSKSKGHGRLAASRELYIERMKRESRTKREAPCKRELIRK